ncbi:MAG: flagellar motor protein [Deltaproteobacteria bacterium]|nr:flagellar motor protein [Deltaproteobacteria bacterium]
MDISLLFGLLFGIACILVGNNLEHGSINDVVGGPAALIVLGGTVGAVFVQFPPDVIKGMGGWFSRLLKNKHVDHAKLIDEIVDLATRARREGILGLEKLAPNVSHPFLSRALMMAIDGADSNTIRDTMEISMQQEEESAENVGKAFEAAGGYAPTVGIIGAVLGLMQVMKNLSDIEAVGRGIATAFIATVYGVAFANLIMMPLGGRVKLRAKEASHLQEMMLQGVLAIQEGTNPKLVRDRLTSFLKESERPQGGGGEG